MAIYLVNHKHGCGCEEIEADSPEQAIEIRRSQLTEREAGYQMFATLADTMNMNDPTNTDVKSKGHGDPVIGIEVANRTGEMRGKVTRELPDTIKNHSRLYLIEWENGSVSTVWDSELIDPRDSEFSKLGGFYKNALGILQVCKH